MFIGQRLNNKLRFFIFTKICFCYAEEIFFVVVELHDFVEEVNKGLSD